VWRCLRDPTFSRFSKTSNSDRQTDRRVRHFGVRLHDVSIVPSLHTTKLDRHGN